MSCVLWKDVELVCWYHEFLLLARVGSFDELTSSCCSFSLLSKVIRPFFFGFRPDLVRLFTLRISLRAFDCFSREEEGRGLLVLEEGFFVRRLCL